MKPNIASQPFFSVIIPCLDEERYLPHLLSDLAGQTSSNFEVIVVDGYSKDKTLKKAAAFSDRLPISIEMSEVRNVSVQRNLGAKLAKGQYLLFIDADSRLPSYFLEGLKYRLHVHKPEVFTLWCNPDSAKASDKAITTIVNLIMEAGLLIDSPVAWGCLLGCTPSVFNKLRGFDPKVSYAEDTDFVLRCYKSGASFAVFQDPRWTMSLRRYRKNGTMKTIQKTAVLNLKRFLQADINQPKEYPMGGAAIEDMRTLSFVNRLQTIMKKITTKPKLVQKLRSLLEVEE